jgi:ATP-dependent Clp protease ATP-binding subunit ClpA
VDGREFFGAVRAEADRLGHEAYRSEHVLLAMLRDPSGAVQFVLRELGVEPSAVEEEANRRTPRPYAARVRGQMPFEHEMKAVLEAALEEAGGTVDSKPTAVHLLLALVRSEGLGGDVLRSRGVREEDVRRIATLLG